MKDLTVKDLKDAFGDEYPAINHLVEGKSDDHVFSSWGLEDLAEYFVWYLWNRKDIKYRLEEIWHNHIEPSDENVNKIFEELIDRGENDSFNETESFAEWVNEDIDQVIGELFGYQKIN